MRRVVTHWTCNDCWLTIIFNQKKVMWSLGGVGGNETLSAPPMWLFGRLIGRLLDHSNELMNPLINRWVGWLVGWLIGKQLHATLLHTSVQSTCTPLQPKNVFKTWENRNWESVEQHLNQCSVNESVKFPSVCPNPFFPQNTFYDKDIQVFHLDLSHSVTPWTHSPILLSFLVPFADSYLQTNSSKDFQRCVIDMLEDAEVVSTMLIPGVCLCVSVCLSVRERETCADLHVKSLNSVRM